MIKIALKILITFIVMVYTTKPSAEIFTAHCRDYAPILSFVDGQCVGAVPDLMTDIMNELGHEISWIKAPWIRSIKAAKDGSVDLLIRHSMTPERKLFLDAITYGYYIRELSFYKSPHFNSSVNSYSDLKEHNIGAIRGNFYSPRFENLDTKILTLVGTTKQLIGMLDLGRIDLAVTSSSHSEELFKHKFEKASFVDSFYNPLYVSIPKKSKASKYYKTIAKVLLDYRKSGKINQYFIKYKLPIPKQIFE